MVVVPRSAAIQQAENELASLALLAMVVGRRSPVTTTLVREHLHTAFGIVEDLVSVRRFWPHDFIMRFSRREDREMVLGTPSTTVGPFTLRWCPWSRLIMASTGAFRYRVLVGMKGIPSHARSKETAKIILGSSCARV
jgi:hypothetical protein